MPKSIAFITSSSVEVTSHFPSFQMEASMFESNAFELPFTPDDQLVVDALRREGFVVEAVNWGVSPALLEAFDLVVMRSPWDYSHTEESRQQFCAWLHALNDHDPAIPLENSVDLMVWLLDKQYLLDFQSEGVSIVPTECLPKGLQSKEPLITFLVQHQGAILKPCVSASGKGLFFIQSVEELHERWHVISQALSERDYLLQPFLSDIQTEGEWSLMYLDGQYSHAVRKRPASGQILVQSNHGGQVLFEEPPEAVIQFGQQVMDVLPSVAETALNQKEKTFNQQLKDKEPFYSHRPMYMRLDIIPSAEGLVLTECEGVEPELFFRANPKSIPTFFQAVLSRIR